MQAAVFQASMACVPAQSRDMIDLGPCRKHVPIGSQHTTTSVNITSRVINERTTSPYLLLGQHDSQDINEWNYAHTATVTPKRHSAREIHTARKTTKAFRFEPKRRRCTENSRPQSTAGAMSSANPARASLVTWLPAHTVANTRANACMAAARPWPLGTSAMYTQHTTNMVL
eukprot:315100-Chlamydomonas_euryale.AAC.7